MLYIPLAEWPAILAYNSVYDASAAFNQAIGANRITLIPPGGYFGRLSINMTARREQFTYIGRQLIGAGMQNTILNWYTGNYPCIDVTGNSSCVVRDFAIRSDNPAYAPGLVAADCASVAILNQRGSSFAFTQFCHANDYQSIRVNLTSDLTRNAGTGTVGFINCGGEHLNLRKCEFTANIPRVLHNVLQFVISHPSNLPVVGVQYEPPYSGAPISCTIMQFDSCIWVALDSLRIGWHNQIAMLRELDGYYSTRKLNLNVPAYLELFLHDSDTANVFLEAYAECSGVFSGVYRMDHAYFSLGGNQVNLKACIQQAPLDMGFTIPGAAVPSLRMFNNVYLEGCDFDCNYLIGTYTATGDNVGLAAQAFQMVSGAPNAILNSRFLLDHSGSHSADIWTPVLAARIANSDSLNFISGDSYFGTCDIGTFTAVIVGLTTAGVGTYTTQVGKYVRNGRDVSFEVQLAWTAHTGTGIMTVQGFPLLTEAAALQTCSVDYDGLLVGAGKQLSATFGMAGTTLFLRACDPAGGAIVTLLMDAAVTGLTITGKYRIGGSL